MTGDDFVRDKNGVFHFVARADDMIISAGYNIAGPEVEAALLSHAEVAECAVVGVPDLERGQIVQAHVVLKEGVRARRGVCEAAAGTREGEDCAVQVPALRQVRERAAQDADRQDPALQAEVEIVRTRLDGVVQAFGLPRSSAGLQACCAANGGLKPCTT